MPSQHRHDPKTLGRRGSSPAVQGRANGFALSLLRAVCGRKRREARKRRRGEARFRRGYTSWEKTAGDRAGGDFTAP
jgi:hypothetical protein